MARSEIYLKTATLEALQTGVIVHGADTAVIFSNPSAALCLGLTVEQMSGRAAPDPHWCLYRPDGSTMTIEEYPVSRAVQSGHAVVGMLLGVPDTSSGAPIRWMLVNATPVFDEGGKLDLVIVEFNDITDRRWLEIELQKERDKHRIMLHNASDGMCIVNEFGCVEEASDSWGAQLGYAREEVIGMHISQWEAATDPLAIPGFVESIIKGGKRVQFETRHRCKDGAILEVEVSAVPFDLDGRPLVYCLTRNVAARKEAQAKAEASRRDLERQVKQRTADLSQALLKAQAANRAKDLFLSSMSHELRTPLHAVLGYAQLLLAADSASLGPAQKSQAEQIVASAEHLPMIVSDLLDLAHIESGKLDICIQPVDIKAKLSKVCSSLGPQAAKADVQLIDEVTADGYWVLADGLRLRQCLLNLVSNGIKYNRRGGQVRISARREEQGFAIDVADTGHGMREEQLQQLFERFNRLGLEASGIEGTGIGLALTRQLVEQMHGRISVASTPGQGSTFSIWLPATTSPPLPEPTQDTAFVPVTSIAPTTPMPFGTLPVLYVEDNEVNVMLMQAIASKRPQVQLHLATSGAEAMETVRQIRPLLVLMDMNLGDCHGIDLIGRMRSASPDDDVLYVAVSAEASGEQINLALRQGFDRYLTKPLRLEALLALFDEVHLKAGGARKL